MSGFALTLIGAQFVGAALAALAALVAWRQRPQPGSLPLTLLMLSVTAWGVSAGTKNLIGLEQKHIWDAIEILASGISSVLYLLFILEYVRQEKLIRRWTMLLLWIVPVGSALMAYVNGRLFFGPPPGSDPGLGWNSLMFVFLLYYYALRLVATFLLAGSILSFARASRPQAWTLTAGALAPWLSNIAYVAIAPAEQFSPGSLALHPLAYALGGLILGWGILRYQILEVVPLARDLVLEHLRDAVIILDSQNRIVDLNQPAEGLLGISLKQVFGKPITETLSQAPVLRDYLQTGVQGGQVYLPLPLDRYFEIELIPVADRRGLERGKLIVLHDISERKQVEEELRRGRAQLRLIFDYAGLGIRITDRDGRYQFVNDRWAEMLCVDPEKLIGQEEVAFLHTNHIPYNREQHQALLKGNINLYHIENRYINSRGKAFWGEITVSPTLNEAGEIESTIGFIIDITKRKQAEMALRETERRFREILENIQMLAVMLNADGNVTFCNNHLQSVTGWKRDEILGRNWFELSMETDESVRNDFVRAVRLGAIVSRHESTLQTREGEKLIISWSNIALKDENNLNIGMASLGLDITERRRAHEAEREQRLLAESLTSTAEILASSLKFSETLKLILENVGKVVPHEAANVSLIEGKIVRYVGARGYEEKGLPLHALETLRFKYKSVANLRRMYETKQPVVISYTEADPDWELIPEAMWIKSYIGAPILIQDKVVGFLSLDSDKPGFFKESHVQRLAAFSVQAAIAIENARLFEKTQRLLEERSKAQSRLRRANKRLETQIAETEILQARLREQVIRDPLTGLFNRRYLDETMAREIARAERDDLPISILMFDIDHFKNVNDTYGHEAGDLLLKSLAGILLKESRRSDIACRFGGEEFCVIMTGAPLQIAQQRAESWRKAFSSFSIQYKQHVLAATVSIGIAVYPEHGLTGNEVLRCADDALYAAKQSGRNRVVVAPFSIV